jgi:hypothetical protein
MHTFKMLIVASTLSALVGCSNATLNREDCLRGDWFELGIQDGLAGKTLGELNLHKQACFEYGVTPDQKPYMAGREKGLVDYCKIENAVTTGLNGHLYQSVCPKEIDAAFRQQNLAAYNLYLTYMRNSYYNNYNGYGYYGGYGGYGNFGSYWGNPGFGYYGGHRGFRPFGSFGIGGRW